jgi:hypothetical protein
MERNISSNNIKNVITTAGPSMVYIQQYHRTVRASYTPKQVLHYKKRNGKVCDVAFTNAKMM